MNELTSSFTPIADNFITHNIDAGGRYYEETHLQIQPILKPVINRRRLTAIPVHFTKLNGVAIIEKQNNNLGESVVIIRNNNDFRLSRANLTHTSIDSPIEIRRSIDENSEEYVVINKINTKTFSQESVFSKPKIDYNIEDPLIHSFRYTTLGSVSTWMEEIFVKKKINAPAPVPRNNVHTIKTKLRYLGPVENKLVDNYTLKNEKNMLTKKSSHSEHRLKTRLVYRGSLSNEPLI